jgi:hypothetical protein
VVQTIQVSDELYRRLQRTAEATHQPIEHVVEQALSAGLPPSAEDVPPAFRADVHGLEELGDDDLWAIWRTTASAQEAARHHSLLDRQAANTLTSDERKELGRLRHEADRRLIRRAHAAALLRWRGHAVPIDG